MFLFVLAPNLTDCKWALNRFIKENCLQCTICAVCSVHTMQCVVNTSNVYTHQSKNIDKLLSKWISIDMWSWTCNAYSFGSCVWKWHVKNRHDVSIAIFMCITRLFNLHTHTDETKKNLKHETAWIRQIGCAKKFPIDSLPLIICVFCYYYRVYIVQH